jgi:hypothetical protein
MDRPPESILRRSLVRSGQTTRKKRSNTAEDARSWAHRCEKRGVKSSWGLATCAERVSHLGTAVHVAERGQVSSDQLINSGRNYAETGHRNLKIARISVLIFRCKLQSGHFGVHLSLAAFTLFLAGRKRCTARHSSRGMSRLCGAM